MNIGIAGFCGKMGTRIFALAAARKELKVTVALESSGHPKLDQNIGGLTVTDDPSAIERCDCLIDFTSPEATLDHLKFALKFKKRLVIGTTGLTGPQQESIEQAGCLIPIVYSPNMSVGVALLFRLASLCAKKLPHYEVCIEEAHHIHKKDAPSGTAKKIADIINAEGFNIKHSQIRSRREGEIIGDHTIVFESEVDTITISHSAKTRDIFAQGAIRAAEWLKDKNAGLYSMADVLQIK